jgi:hypothetical protein
MAFERLFEKWDTFSARVEKLENNILQTAPTFADTYGTPETQEQGTDRTIQ